MTNIIQWNIPGMQGLTSQQHWTADFAVWLLPTNSLSTWNSAECWLQF